MDNGLLKLSPDIFTVIPADRGQEIRQQTDNNHHVAKNGPQLNEKQQQTIFYLLKNIYL